MNDKCFHCSNDIIDGEEVWYDDKVFCCFGCKTVYEILSENNLTAYYNIEKNPGNTPSKSLEKFAYLDNETVVEKLLDFRDGQIAMVHFFIPNIHCSSCIWVLENLHKINKNIGYAHVDFSKKNVSIQFNPEKTTLKEIVLLLAKLGYEPYISLEESAPKNKWIDRSLIYKIGVAFFGFGNIMLLSFPEYFGIEDIWMDEYRNFFRYLNVALAIPVFFYSASPYFKSAFDSLKNKRLNIDVPMALGILVMFVRSLADIFIFDGAGFLDSMCGLVFFMLSGKLIQQTTYGFLSFERDYKSYFPIAVTQIINGKENAIEVYQIKPGDRLLIRNEEIIPVDAILESEEAYIDYSFVTGEAEPIVKKPGEKIFAGGKQMGKIIEISATNTVSQSYLTELWSNEIFQKNVNQKYIHITDRAGRIFTPILLFLAIGSFIFWSVKGNFIDAFNVFTAVLIVACPCAIALTAPYTWGNVIRILGKKKFYLKNTIVIEQLAQIDTIVFDKTGTITASNNQHIIYEGKAFSDDDKVEIKSIVRGSNHPLSRLLYAYIQTNAKLKSITHFEEISGKGIQAQIGENQYKIGAINWIKNEDHSVEKQTSVGIVKNGDFLGKFIFNQKYREGLNHILSAFKNINYQLHLLSGDHDGEKIFLTENFPQFNSLHFQQKPIDKLNFIKNLQQSKNNVAMIGDGLNDSGALAQSHVGISIADNINVFTPASDAILDASVFHKLPQFLRYCKDAMRTIKYSYVLALIYNTIGISFALSNQLSPLVAAIIMPLSTITIISFVTFMSNYYAKRRDL